MKENEALRTTDGIEMYGLYTEAVEVLRSTKKPRRYWRFFLVNDHLYVYARHANKNATTWRKLKYPDTEGARQRLLETLSGTATVEFVLRGEPVLTQLRATDVISIERGQVPPARYQGQQRVERAIGKFDNDTWIAETETTVPPTSTSASGGSF